MIQERPKSVAIVAMGASAKTWLGAVVSKGSHKCISDETWAVNSMGAAIRHDRLFMMDDLDILRPLARQDTESMVAGLLADGFLNAHPGPIYVPRVHAGYPGMVEYPLEAVVNNLGIPYLNTTVAYTLAYAIYLGVQEISMYGCDFTYPDKHIAEGGRGCCEFLMGIGGSRGIRFAVAADSTLMDSCIPLNKRFYGYGCDMKVEYVDNKVKITRGDAPSPPAAPATAPLTPAPLRLTAEAG